MSQTRCRITVRICRCWGAEHHKAVVMIYYENRDPETGATKEIVGAWIFAIILVGLVMFVLGIFD